MSLDERTKIIKEYKNLYWLQAFGCEERLSGSKPLIQSRVSRTNELRVTFSFVSVQYVQTCLRLDKPLYFKLINVETTIGSGKKRCLTMIQEAIKQEEERKKPQSE